MTFIIVENLRGFFNSRPPLVVFMICLASFAIALITFAYIVKTKDMPNPDVSDDWNTLLQKISQLQFCVSQNGAIHNVTSQATKVTDLTQGDAVQTIKDKLSNTNAEMAKDVEKSSISKRAVEDKEVTPTQNAPGGNRGKAETTNKKDETSTASTSSSPVNRDGIVNVTFHLRVHLIPSPELLAQPLSTVHFTAAVTGNMLDMKGALKDQKVQMTMSFPSNLSDGICAEMTGTECTMHEINTCITFSGPAYMLPRAQRHNELDVCPGDVEFGADGLVRNMTVATPAVSSGRNWCAHGGRLMTTYTFDDSLTIMLSQDDRSRINLHLMRTSYFLFVMVVTLFCYAMIKGRPGKVKTVVHIPYDKVSSQA